MKILLLFVLVFQFVFCSQSAPVPADEIMAFVRAKLPSEPLKLAGTLKVRTAKGFTSASLPVQMELDWGAATPTAIYRIGDQSLAIAWQDGHPAYTFSTPGTQPGDKILGTGVNWADLSFSMLWWPNAMRVDEQKKINRECHVVDVPVPGSDLTMRLWIEKKMGMLLEAQTLDASQKEIRSMEIKSIKKMDGMWIAKDLEIADKLTGSKTILQISDLQWKNPKPVATAFDPAESVNALAFELYQQLANQKGNLFLSPYSISSALAMTYGGARGETADQMNDVLAFGGPGVTPPAFAYLRNTLTDIQEKGNIELRVANKLWAQKGYQLLPDYLAMIKEFYGSEIQNVPFMSDPEAARAVINGWGEKQTNNRIKDLIPNGVLDPSTRLVLANAIYFKGNWASQFKPEATRPAPFKLADGSTIEVPMMSQAADFKLAHTDKLQALELPYAGNELSMIILLPNPGEEPPLPALADLEFNEMEVLVQLPKFKIESSFGLADALASMGMPLAFSDQADFSGMTGTRDLSIGAVVHKAFVEVNEAGTEAAAATAVVMARMSMPPQFIANHPFLFLIRENSTGAILFIGRVADPST